MQHPQATARPERRLDLQGLRAIAVLLVALDHARVRQLAGGYVGVDVFFVLSGFFITQVLLAASVDGHGILSGLGDFYKRRIKRILPAACLTLVVTNIAVALFVNYVSAASIYGDSWAAAFFYANFHFAATATNYFAQAVANFPSPVQHYWSLSVEEQFYFVWPSLVFGGFFLARQLNRRRTGGRGAHAAARPWLGATPTLAVIVFVCFTASLIYSISYTYSDPLAAYFSTFARAWELALGAGIAVAAPWLRRQPVALRVALSVVGLGAVLYAATSFSGKTVFPGYAALVPTVGSALLIIAGIGTRAPLFGRLLGSLPMRYIGDRSYTFYLWHFPTLIIAEQIAGRPQPVTTNLLLLVGAFALSVVTYGLYENPLRHANWFAARRLAFATPAFVGAALLSVVVARAAAPHPERLRNIPVLTPAPGQLVATKLLSSKPIPAVASAADAARHHAPVPARLAPPLTSFENPSNSNVPSGCTALRTAYRSQKLCPRGDVNAKRVIVMLGDSHAGMWMPAVSYASQHLGYKLIELSHSGCELDRITRNLPGYPCKQWFDWATATARSLHPVATLIAFRTDQYHTPKFPFVVRRLRQVLLQVPNGILIADPPPQYADPPECLASAGANLGRCSTWLTHSNRTLLTDVGKMIVNIHRPVIPTLQWFCAHYLCPMVVNHTITRRDTSHLTGTYSRELGPLLLPALKAALKRSAADQRAHIVRS